MSQNSAQKESYKQIRCAYHPQQILTNFCPALSCLMPLCPTCLVEHTQQHTSKGDRVSYLHLGDALAAARKQSMQFICDLEDLGVKNDQINGYMKGLPQHIKVELHRFKHQIIEKIENQFQDIEKSLLNSIKNKYKQDNVFVQQHYEMINQLIKEQVDKLYSTVMKLKGNSCISSLINFCESKTQHEQTLKHIQEHIRNNQQAGGIRLVIDLQIQNQILSLCKQLINVDYVRPAPSVLKDKNSDNSSFQKNSNQKRGVNNQESAKNNKSLRTQKGINSLQFSRITAEQLSGSRFKCSRRL